MHNNTIFPKVKPRTKLIQAASLLLSVFISVSFASASRASDSKLTDLETPDAEFNTRSFSGKAYDLNSNELLYTEHHQYSSKFSHSVDYKTPDGDIFARKTLNYEHGYFSPDFVQENTRNGELIRSHKKGKKVTLEYKENDKSTVEVEKIKVSENLIIDAGFNNFITENWAELISGKELAIEYLVPSMLDSFELNVKKVRCSNDDDYCFSISSSSFFLRLFSNNLKLTYSKFGSNDYQLSVFQGRSNICDEDGNYLDVRIQYSFL